VGARFILSDYLAAAMAEAVYEKLEDGTYAGRIPSCPGVVAFGASLRECEEEVRSTLEDWTLGFRIRNFTPLPKASVAHL
jgi:predicted RNase H-like HicB family nuclease